MIAGTSASAHVAEVTTSEAECFPGCAVAGFPVGEKGADSSWCPQTATMRAVLTVGVYAFASLATLASKPVRAIVIALHIALRADNDNAC